MCVRVRVCVRNGHMIIHSHETIEELVSYYGMIRWSHTDAAAMLCVFAACVYVNISHVCAVHVCTYLHESRR